MPAHAEIDVRMKENYEFPYRFKLTKRTPVIVRVDGRAFHSFTKGFAKPFDTVLIKSMQDTAKYLCENVMGCKLAYVQSDEISLLLVDYESLDSQPFFDNNLQKICSITASMATLAFNKAFEKHVKNLDPAKVNNKLLKKYESCIEKGGMFDSRCFNIPQDEVCNYFFSRQIDASRNSVEMVGRAYFSHKELHLKNGSMIQDMLHEQHGVNWNDFPIEQKRGACIVKEYYYVDKDGNETVVLNENCTKRSRWIVDHEIPQFKGDNRQYIDRYVFY